MGEIAEGLAFQASVGWVVAAGVDKPWSVDRKDRLQVDRLQVDRFQTGMLGGVFQFVGVQVVALFGKLALVVAVTVVGGCQLQHWKLHQCSISLHI